MIEARRNLLRAALTLAMTGTAFVILVLLVFLGAITQRFPCARLIEALHADWTGPIASGSWTWFLLSGEWHSSGKGLTFVDLAVSAALVISLLVATVGVAAVRRRTEVLDSAPGGLCWPMWLMRMDNAAAAFTAAALAATLLETAGLWKRLVPDSDPLADKGAPVWVWWILLLISFLLWFLPRRRRLRALGGKILIRKTSIVILAGLIVFSCAAFLHAIRPDPVQGRYYGIPGFTVGRQFSNEYGTYYGSTGGAAASILGFSALLLIFYRARKKLDTDSAS
jgi:hypothetical protein